MYEKFEMVNEHAEMVSAKISAKTKPYSKEF
jgi:hypothetical protein